MKKLNSIMKQALMPWIIAVLLIAGTAFPVSAVAITPISPITPIDPGVIIKPISLDYSYDIANGEATISGYLGSGGNITIPATLGGYPVTAIKNQAFAGTSSLTGVVIPDSVKKIGYNAFSNCENLKTVMLPKYLTVIADELFYECKSLTSVNIPESVTKIEPCAFSYTAITSLNLSKNVNDFNVYQTFMDKLTAINVDPLNSTYASQDGVLYSKDKKYLIKYPEAKAATSFSVPNGTVFIQPGAFQKCSVLQNITIPDSVHYVIGSFSACKSLESVVFQGATTEISKFEFYNCTALTTITLPIKMEYIPEHCFDNCTSLKSVAIPDTVTTIGSNAFKDCAKLSSVTLPAALTEIGSVAFYGCKSISSISIPAGVKIINSSAFYGCSNLTSVTIPSNVTTMGAFVFKDCSNLKDARFKGDAPRIGKELFFNTAPGFLIYFPVGAEGWTTPTWYGYPTQAYSSFAALPVVTLRPLPTFTMPRIIIDDSILLDLPILEIPAPPQDEAPELLPPVPVPPVPVPQGTTEIKLYLGNSVYLVNGESKMMDASPLLMNSRILLPVRYVAEPLGAAPVWDPVDQKVTVTLGSTVLELWVGNNIARVNGVEKMIDPDNPDVKPIIVPPGRTMMPLRFLGESLGCTVLWNQQLSEATLTKAAAE